MRVCEQCGHQFTWSETGWAAVNIAGTARCAQCGRTYRRIDHPRWVVALLGGIPWFLSGALMFLSRRPFSLWALIGYALAFYALIVLSARNWTQWTAVDADEPSQRQA